MICSRATTSSFVLLAFCLSVSNIQLCNAQFNWLSQFFTAGREQTRGLLGVKSITRKIDNPATFQTTVQNLKQKKCSYEIKSVIST